MVQNEEWRNRTLAEHAYTKNVNIMFHKMSPMIRSSGTISFSRSYRNSRLGFGRLKYLYSVISVIVNLLFSNTNILRDGQSAISRILGGAMLL